MSFAQCGDNGVVCFGCGAPGVKKPQCPKCNPTGSSSLNVTMSHMSGRINPNWLMSDNATPAHIMKNAESSTDIHCGSSAVSIDSTGGITKTKEIGEMPGIKDPTWCVPNGIANMSSFALLAEQHKISCNCDKDEFVVHMGDNTVTFCRSVDGLRCYDTSHWSIEEEENESSQALVDAAEGNMEGFAKRQIENAKLARRIYPMVGRPSPQDFKLMTTEGTLRNAPVTGDDIKNANHVFGPQEVGASKGKSVRQDPTPVATDIMEAPRGTLKNNKKTVLTEDIVFANSLPIVVAHSRNINFATVDLANDKLAKTLFGSVKNAIDHHKSRKFSIKTLLMDSEFEKLCGMSLEKRCDSKCCKCSGAHARDRTTHLSCQGTCLW